MTTHRQIDVSHLPPATLADQPSPMLQWVEIAQMVIDDQYQRPISNGGVRTIKAIAENFRWSCFTPLLLAPIEGGQFAIIDGQHRVHAAAMCGIKSVPAMVVPIAASEQAAAFIQVNSARTAMSNYNLFKAGLTAGEPWALAADKAVADAGCRLMTFNPSTKDRKHGEICSVGLIRDMIKRGHAAAVTVALTAVRAIDNGGQSAVLLYSDWLLNPLVKAVAEFPDLDAQTLTSVLTKRRPAMIIEGAERIAKAQNLPRTTVVKEAFVLEIRQWLANATVAA